MSTWRSYNTPLRNHPAAPTRAEEEEKMKGRPSLPLQSASHSDHHNTNPHKSYCRIVQKENHGQRLSSASTPVSDFSLPEIHFHIRVFLEKDF